MRILLTCFMAFFWQLFPGNFLGAKEKMPVLHENLLQNSDKTEEFINYWKNDFRLDERGEIISICDIKEDSFNQMYYGKYILLSGAEKKVVNQTPDYEEGYTISDSISELVARFSSSSSANNEKITLNQNATIIIVSTIAIFGMTTISIFFLLKKENLIK